MNHAADLFIPYLLAKALLTPDRITQLERAKDVSLKAKTTISENTGIKADYREDIDKIKSIQEDS
jgi:hypothetical protein